MEAKIFMSPMCPWCHKAKDLLESHGVTVHLVNISTDSQGAADMMQASGQKSVPVTVIGNRVIVGYDKDSIEMAINTS
ncbi:glutaredoxin family protein [Nanoarchaeota archaeon]